MKCRICGNATNNKSMELRENLHATKELFSYFQCSECECIQISEIPADIGKYYPADYYAFNDHGGDKYMGKKLDFFRKTQSDYLIHGKSKFLGSLFTIGFPAPKVFTWIRNLKLSKNDRILDIGCGTGSNLKHMYQLGYLNLTGADPFIEKDYSFSESFKIHKIDPLDLDESNRFDCIMMHHSFEHMEHERPILVKAKKLLKPGGKILIRIPVYSQPLLEKYGINLASLDAPRHFYVHSAKSMNILAREAGLAIDNIDYDADEFSFWASEEYIQDICSGDENSYARNRKKSIFSKSKIKEFKKEIKKLNDQRKSDCAAFYISALSN
jgi:SAM-dependent methyltransferase